MIGKGPKAPGLVSVWDRTSGTRTVSVWDRIPGTRTVSVWDRTPGTRTVSVSGQDTRHQDCECL